MIKKENNKALRIFDIHFNKESDFLEIVFAPQPAEALVEEVRKGVFVKKDKLKKTPIGVWVFDYSKNWQGLAPTLADNRIAFPLQILPKNENTQEKE